MAYRQSFFGKITEPLILVYTLIEHHRNDAQIYHGSQHEKCHNDSPFEISRQWSFVINSPPLNPLSAYNICQ